MAAFEWSQRAAVACGAWLKWGCSVFADITRIFPDILLQGMQSPTLEPTATHLWLERHMVCGASGHMVLSSFTGSRPQHAQVVRGEIDKRNHLLSYLWTTCSCAHGNHAAV